MEKSRFGLKESASALATRATGDWFRPFDWFRPSDWLMKRYALSNSFSNAFSGIETRSVAWAAGLATNSVVFFSSRAAGVGVKADGEGVNVFLAVNAAGLAGGAKLEGAGVKAGLVATGAGLIGVWMGAGVWTRAGSWTRAGVWTRSGSAYSRMECGLLSPA